MPRYRITTLVDITRTDAKKSDPNNIRINQQQNFNSLRQTIELRSNIEWDRDPASKSGSLPVPFHGKANHWIWEFRVERDDVFLSDTDPCGLLKQDLNNVPVINGLKETVELDPPAFKTLNGNINTYIEII